MTTASGPAPVISEEGRDRAARASRPWGWRSWVALATWSAVVVGLVVVYQTFWQLLAMSVGQALGSEVRVDEEVPIYWTFVWTAIALAVVTVAAIVGRRWVAMVFALLLVGASGVLAIGLYPSVQSVVAPVEQVDPGPLPCACYSGSICECPGG